MYQYTRGVKYPIGVEAESCRLMTTSYRALVINAPSSSVASYMSGWRWSMEVD